MDVHTLEQIGIGIVVLALVVYRQMRLRPVTGRTVVLPFILLGYGIYSAYFATDATGLLDHARIAMSAAILVTGLLLDVTLGIWRATTMRVWRDEQDVLWRKGTTLTVLAWLVSIGTRLGVGVGIAYLAHVHEPTAVLLLGAGVTLVTQNLVVAHRANDVGERQAAGVS